jgi:hypothetical protein
MERMAMLDFSGNKFQTIFEDSFEMTENWLEYIPKKINLSNCGIKYIESGAFRNPKSLTTLVLNGNTGISLGNLTNLFNSTDSPDIRYVDLSNTSLTDVSGLFLSMKKNPQISFEIYYRRSLTSPCVPLLEILIQASS